MTITEIKQAMGSWNLRLNKGTPRRLMDQLTEFGHIVIVPAIVNVAETQDSLLEAARYVGVYRGRNAKNEYELRGCGLAFWLGEADDQGDIFEEPVVLALETFPNSIRALLPPSGSVTEGTLYSIAGTYTDRHQWVTPRKAIQYVTDTFGGEWRVNPTGTLDAGLVEDLYRVDPVALLVANGEGRDLRRVGLPGQMSMDRNVEGVATRVVLLAEGEGETITTGTADAVDAGYRDLHGNPVAFTKVVSESGTTPENADTRAALQLADISTPRVAVSLESSAYDIKGDVVVGDYIDVYDPDNGFVDGEREVYWNGESINPVKLRCVEMTWPVRAGWTIAFRTTGGDWLDLTDYIEPETGGTNVVVGTLPRSLSSLGGEPIGSRPNAGVDSSVPATPVFNVPFSTAAYQSREANDVRAAVLVTWETPLNEDGSTIRDGDHYEIRYRSTQTFSYPITWEEASHFEWGELGTWARPLSNPAAVSGQWITAYAGWGGDNQLLIQELMIAAEYEFQIRAVDSASPPHQSFWSASVFITTRGDVIPPSIPSGPLVAGSMTAIQVIHNLGKASGGSFNLEPDLDHLEVHVGSQYAFADESTRIGKIIANSGMLLAQIPAVATFQIDNVSQVYVKIVAVDRLGNRSGASVGVPVTVELIDDAHISNLTVSKLTAGTLSAAVILSGSIKTADEGQRVEMNQQGIQVYDSDGELTISLTADPDEPDFISIRNDGVTLSSLDQDGNVSGKTGTFSEDVIIAGKSFLDDYMYPLGKGIVAYGSYDTADVATAGAAEANEKGFGELSFTAEPGRFYRVTIRAQMTSSLASDILTFRLRDGGDDAPTISSPQLLRYEFPNDSDNAGWFTSGDGVYEGEFTEGFHRLLWSFFAGSGTATLRIGNQKAVFMVEDIGPAPENTFIINDGGVGSTPPPAAVSNYTTTFRPTWAQGYSGSNSFVSGTDLGHGYYDSTWGNQRSLIGFDSAAMKKTLSGATIKSCTATLYAKHWYNNSGGTAIIGTHNYTSKPGSWADSRVNQDRMRSTSWPKPGLRTIDLGVTIGNEFKSGTSTGLALGPAPSTSWTYYGRFANITDTKNAPFITIKYTK